MCMHVCMCVCVFVFVYKICVVIDITLVVGRHPHPSFTHRIKLQYTLLNTCIVLHRTTTSKWNVGQLFPNKNAPISVHSYGDVIEWTLEGSNALVVSIFRQSPRGTPESTSNVLTNIQGPVGSTLSLALDSAAALRVNGVECTVSWGWSKMVVRSGCQPKPSCIHVYLSNYNKVMCVCSLLLHSNRLSAISRLNQRNLPPSRSVVGALCNMPCASATRSFPPVVYATWQLWQWMCEWGSGPGAL